MNKSMDGRDTAPGEVDGGLLEHVRRSAAELIAAAPAPLHRLRVRAGDVSVDLEWPRAEQGRAPDPLAPEASALLPVAAAAAAMGPEVYHVRAPTVGTFYRAPEPGAKPFVIEGDLVQPGVQVAILEVMKLMMPIEADRAGRVVEILVGDQEPVEFGTPLIAIAAE